MKIIVFVMLAGVVMSLGAALTSMTSAEDRSLRMQRALTIRVVMSLALVIVLVASWKLGFIEPHAGG